MKTLKLFGKLPLLIILSTLMTWQMPAVAVEAVNADTLPAATQAEKININAANVDELASALNGVGGKKAQAIIDYRQQHGDFVSVDQLLEVKGVGEVLLAKNRHLIVLE